MGDLKTEDWERDKLRGADLFERECVDDWTGQTSYYDRNDEVRAVLDDLDTLLAENAKLAEDYRAVLAGACTSAARAGARDATLRRLEAENARLRAVAEDGRELLRMVSEVYRDPPACGVVAGINIGEIREFLAATDTPKEAP